MEKWSEKMDGAATEYVLAIAPRGEVAEKILEARKEFAESFYASADTVQKPVILLSKLDAREEMEDTLIRWLQKIIGQEQSFLVTLNNYGAVPPNTICLRLQEHAVFFHFLKKLDVLKQYIPMASGFFKRPYLEFAANLPAEVYEKALPHYSRESFHESFVVNELLLMKRENASVRIIKDGQSDHFKTIQVFGLLPQSDLFNRVA